MKYFGVQSSFGVLDISVGKMNSTVIANRLLLLVANLEHHTLTYQPTFPMHLTVTVSFCPG